MLFCWVMCKSGEDRHAQHGVFWIGIRDRTLGVWGSLPKITPSAVRSNGSHLGSHVQGEREQPEMTESSDMF